MAGRSKGHEEPGVRTLTRRRAVSGRGDPGKESNVAVFTPSAAGTVADPHRVRDLAIAGFAVLDRAVRLESAHRAAMPGMATDAEVFTRGQQHAGLLVATVATGLAIGVFFALVYWLVARDATARGATARGATAPDT